MTAVSNIKYFATRSEWRQWLEANFKTEKEVWFVFPSRASGRQGVSYNDAVEEALCFGWIDSTMKKLDDRHTIQWFLPRKNKKYYSTANRERLKWLWDNSLIHPDIRKEVESVVNEEFVFPEDITEALKRDSAVRHNYLQFSASYRRLRVGYIEAARAHPEEFEKRLRHFIARTKANKLIAGHGGINKYY
jgi:uncharacterized protein YdeI (YjbR/CyaY-like superfamily)